MSDFEKEKTKELARGMSNEQMKTFLSEVDDSLIIEEIDKRFREAKNLKEKAAAMLGALNV